ncbi:MAG: hypothetical protein HQ512_00660 [Rhodospirillales bacterium]|nr:hypothetical protein [Rhodospirillales bacterium]
MKRLKTDILILGSGGAGLFAALHAQAPDGEEDMETLRQRLNETMWENAGIVRDAIGLERAADHLYSRPRSS